MKLKRPLTTLVNILMLIGGVCLALYLSSMLTWGQLESSLDMQNTDGSLKLSCPVMIAEWETAQIHTQVTNTLNETVTPTIQTQISHGKESRNSSEKITLEPHETVNIERTADASDIKFNRFILINITQRSYRDLPSHQGLCSIFVYSIKSLSGTQTLYSMIAIIFILIGASLFNLFKIYSPLTELGKKLATAVGFFALAALLGVFSALMRLWGLTIIFDVLFALSIVIIFTDLLSQTGSAE